MTKLVDWYFRRLKFVIVVGLALMVVLVFGNVALRYAFNSDITVSEALSRWLFVWLIFLGATVAMKEHAHLGVDSVVSRLPAWGKKACFVASHVLLLYAVYLLFVGTWTQTVINLDVKAPATGLSSGFFYGIGLVFCATSAAVLVYDLYQMLTGRLIEVELIQVKESEDAREIEELQHELDRQRAVESSAIKNSDSRSRFRQEALCRDRQGPQVSRAFGGFVGQAPACATGGSGNALRASPGVKRESRQRELVSSVRAPSWKHGYRSGVSTAIVGMSLAALCACRCGRASRAAALPTI